MRTYITFGQSHAHSVNGKTFDKDCVAIINADDAEKGRALAMEWFNRQFCFSYTEEQFDHKSMKWFPRGLIEVNP